MGKAAPKKKATKKKTTKKTAKAKCISTGSCLPNSAVSKLGVKVILPKKTKTAEKKKRDLEIDEEAESERDLAEEDQEIVEEEEAESERDLAKKTKKTTKKKTTKKKAAPKKKATKKKKAAPKKKATKKKTTKKTAKAKCISTGSCLPNSAVSKLGVKVLLPKKTKTAEKKKRDRLV